MARLASIGSALQDIYLIDHDDFCGSPLAGQCEHPTGIVIGTKVDIDRVSFEVGGGGTNAAVTFARHGHESIFLGNIGNDPAGDAIVNGLIDEGVDTSYISHTHRKTGLSVVLLDTRSGERTILTHRGASGKFNNLDETDLERIRPDWIYVTSLRGDMDTLLRLFEKAHEIGAKVMFNPGVLEIAQEKKLKGLLEDVDFLLVNKVEAAQIVPGKLLEELITHLGAYCPGVIITAGAMGAIATNGKETYRFGIYEDIPVKDTTGAGDAFGSGFLAHYAAGKSFEESLIFGSANSTAVVQHLGAKAGLLYGDEELHPMPIQKI